MKIKILLSVTVAAAIVGCILGWTQPPQHLGGPADNDQNVLTGGPITGTTIQDLPQSVKDQLVARAPHAEIESIVRTRRHDAVVYDISFVNPNKTREMYLSDDGKVLAALAKAQP